MKGVLETRREFQDGEKSVDDIAHGVNIPVQVIWGESDQIMHVAGADVIASKRPDIPIHRLPDVGHSVMFEVPQTAAELLREFIQKLDGTKVSDENRASAPEPESQQELQSPERSHARNKRHSNIFGFPRHGPRQPEPQSTLGFRND